MLQRWRITCLEVWTVTSEGAPPLAAVRVTLSAGSMMLQSEGAPDRTRQFRQWQMLEDSGGPTCRTLTATAPQKQLASSFVMAASIQSIGSVHSAHGLAGARGRARLTDLLML